MFVYVGAYTESPAGTADGISVYRFDPQTGALSLSQVAAGSPNPSFLALAPDGRHLYAVSELDSGGVRSFVRNPVTGELSALNHQPSHGSSPCYISVDPTGRYALVANYGDGVVTALPIAADGHLQPATSVVQQEGSSVWPGDRMGRTRTWSGPTPDGRYVLVDRSRRGTDLRIPAQCRIAANWSRTTSVLPRRRPNRVPGRAISPSRRWPRLVYVVNETRPRR